MSEENECRCYVPPSDLCPMHNDDRIKTLESKLREAEEIIKSHEDMLLPALKAERVSLESRLKEAEGLLSQETSEFKSAAFQKIKSLEQRLSHLMDVAKKLANWINSEVNYRDGQYCNSKLGDALLAEWDGIKKEEKS